MGHFVRLQDGDPSQAAALLWVQQQDEKMAIDIVAMIAGR